MASIRHALRQAVVERAQGRCEYCRTTQAIVVEMEVDHIIPRSAGGASDLANLCLSCVGCNGFKLAYQTGIDPNTGEEAPLFHPRSHRWDEHFGWSADGTRILGMTPIGRATVARLRMNRAAMTDARRLWVQAGWHPPR
ncbi:MAG: HNH endonuclease [Chloroflexota bacterium]